MYLVYTVLGEKKYSLIFKGQLAYVKIDQLFAIAYKL